MGPRYIQVNYQNNNQNYRVEDGTTTTELYEMVAKRVGVEVVPADREWNLRLLLGAVEMTAKTAVDVMVVLDISGSMSTECKVQDASGKAQKHGFSILDVCKHATRALAATLDADSRLGLITFDNIAELVLPSSSVDEDHVAFRRPKLQSRRARLLTANPHLISFLKKIVQPVSAPLRLDAARLTAIRAGQTAPRGPRRPRPPGVHEFVGRPRKSIGRAS